MTTFQYLNLLLINAIAWVIMSYFWSFWTFKLFKPFKWLEFTKQKEVPEKILKWERKEKDRIRFYTLWLQLERINRYQIPGCLAEVGVYRGETARIIHHMLPEKIFYLFDSFEGLPRQVIREDCDGKVRPYAVNFGNTSPQLVMQNIKGNANLNIRSGVFPETANGLENESFAFVHIDADLYQTTLEALMFFYPRLQPGGVILIHDYNHNWSGVTKAVDEFALRIPEAFVEMPDQLGSVVLIKGKITA